MLFIFFVLFSLLPFFVLGIGFILIGLLLLLAVCCISPDELLQKFLVITSSFALLSHILLVDGWVLLLQKLLERPRVLLIVGYTFCEFVDRRFLFLLILNIVNTCCALWTYSFTRFEFLEEHHIKGKRINALFRQVLEAAGFFKSLSHEVDVLEAFHLVPDIVNIFIIENQNVTVLICNDPAVCASAPSIVDA